MISLGNAGLYTRVKMTETINMYQRISALKLAKECNEAIFKLIEEGPSVMYLKQLQEKLSTSGIYARSVRRCQIKKNETN